jgi:hypothetical protein
MFGLYDTELDYSFKTNHFMKLKFSTILSGVVIMAATMLAVSCQKNKSGDKPRLQVRLTDAPDPNVKEVWVDIKGIAIKMGDSAEITLTPTPDYITFSTLQTEKIPSLPMLKFLQGVFHKSACYWAIITTSLPKQDKKSTSLHQVHNSLA